MKILLKRILKFFGFELRRINNTKNIKNFYSNLNQLKIIDLEKLSVYNSFIDGMITDYQGKIIFILCLLINAGLGFTVVSMIDVFAKQRFLHGDRSVIHLVLCRL